MAKLIDIKNVSRPIGTRIEHTVVVPQGEKWFYFYLANIRGVALDRTVAEIEVRDANNVHICTMGLVGNPGKGRSGVTMELPQGTYKCIITVLATITADVTIVSDTVLTRA